MDLIRRIALATEALPPGKTLHELDGVSEIAFFEHARWMAEAGLLHVLGSEYLDQDEPGDVTVQRLTWAGCEFADAARSDTLWKKAKEQVIKPGASFTFDLLKEWLKAEIAQGLPTLRGLLK